MHRAKSTAPGIDNWADRQSREWHVHLLKRPTSAQCWPSPLRLYSLMALLGNLMLSVLEKFTLRYKPIFLILAGQTQTQNALF